MNKSSKDYYKILGLSEEDKKLQVEDFKKKLKANYRKLCIEFHPDKQQGKTDKEKEEAENKFKEIAEAYDVLSDDKKRNEYNSPTPNPFEGFGGVNWEDGFGFADIFSGFKNGRPQNFKGQSMRLRLGLTLEELYYGVSKDLKFKRNGKCPHCNGSGETSSSRWETCPTCGGCGSEFFSFRNMQQLRTCSRCGGSCKILTNPCPYCNGSGLTEEEATVHVDVPRGAFDGYEMEFRGYGSSTKNNKGENGDLYIIVHELPHKKFKKDVHDLYFQLDVPILDAILGGNVAVETIDGKKFQTKIPQGVKDGQKIRFKKNGMPIYNTDRYGDLYGVVNFKLPTSITDEERQKLQELQGKGSFAS
jgi:molecular chaperone DnaJ